jgi:hypothetical protein
MLDFNQLSLSEREKLVEIVKYSRDIQTKYSIIRELKKEIPQRISSVKKICKNCKDEGCNLNNDCEVKKAYMSLISLKE